MKSASTNAAEDQTSSPEKTSFARLGTALFLGTALEWYDYFVYGVAAALVLNKLFFPSYNPTVGTLFAFGTFASAWLMRPLGAYIFGHLGDRYGRRTVLFITLIGMGLATIATGLLPTYDQIGFWAPLLLVFFRMIQGLSAGGEFSGVATLSIEHAPAHLRGRYTSVAQMGIPAALVAANLVSLIAYYMPEDALESYGWRIPFLVSALIFPIALYIRLKLEESPVFEEKKANKTLVKNPAKEVIRNHWRTMLALGFANGGLGAAFYAYSTYAVNFGSAEVGLSRTTVLLAVIVAGLVHLCCVGVVGWHSDRLGPKRIFLSALTLLAIAPIPVFWIIHTGSAVAIVAAMIIGLGIGHGVAYSVTALIFTTVFPPELRYTGSALTYQVSAALLSGPVPIFMTALVGAGGGSFWYAAIFLTGICTAGLLGAVLIDPAVNKSHAVAAARGEV
ncbi:MFS transporter [Rhodococcus sp. 06-156-3C]|uniref:MFS transporter n=1 Tax=Nocardiaceae TaxID=85025 RepID=UPI00068B197F|nr:MULTISPECIES: MFS transporter [Rhodococcus]OZD08783.1 MFS transporter [Rhodococcus sp. 06-156-4C]OZD17360.1 MFS transporter [Rhodococcus sp. 06-156-3C]OZD18697.1 MFS transporter [Rhodococcus sp. 06-156-4a]OZD25104.1 MFS transporter [Rhodococcus sp. 06-156-3b]OZD34263.1 MFS transporter [Rhodococcus sp. 06-156-3]